MAVSLKQQANSAAKALSKKLDELFTQEQQARIEWACNNDTPDLVQWRFTLDGHEHRLTYRHQTKTITHSYEGRVRSEGG